MSCSALRCERESTHRAGLPHPLAAMASGENARSSRGSPGQGPFRETSQACTTSSRLHSSSSMESCQPELVRAGPGWFPGRGPCPVKHGRTAFSPEAMAGEGCGRPARCAIRARSAELRQLMKNTRHSASNATIGFLLCCAVFWHGVAAPASGDSGTQLRRRRRQELTGHPRIRRRRQCVRGAHAIAGCHDCGFAHRRCRAAWHIVYSDDVGRTWVQAKVPVETDLVSVCFRRQLLVGRRSRRIVLAPRTAARAGPGSFPVDS